METKQLITASAEVVTITAFKAGDVYKRVDSSGYGEPVLRFGIVQDVMNNGSDAAFTALEFRPDYHNGIEVDLKVYDGSKAAALFAAQPDEVTKHLDDLATSADTKARRVREELAKAESAVAAVRDIRAQIATAGLTAPTVAGELVSGAPDDSEDTGPGGC